MITTIFFLLLPTIITSTIHPLIITTNNQKPPQQQNNIICTSLQGPFCQPINGLRPPRHSPPSTSTANDKSLGEVLADLLKTHGRSFFSSGSSGATAAIINGAGDATIIPLTTTGITSFFSTDKNNDIKTTRGVFKITGTNNRKSIRFDPIKPIPNVRFEQWVVKPPPGWIPVAAHGGYDDVKDIITLTLLDDVTEKPQPKCSSLILTRIVTNSKNQQINNPALELALGADPLTNKLLSTTPTTASSSSSNQNNPLKAYPKSITGVWSGKYACTGSRTHAIIVIQESNTLKYSFTGTFSFVATSFPGRDVTKSGCVCLSSWQFLDTTITGGKCAYPKVNMKGGPFCYFEPDTCYQKPANDDWDFCDEDVIIKSNTNNNKQTQNKKIRKTKFAINDRVAARWKGYPVFYMGRITKINRDGTYSISYDDGDFEESVSPTLIRDVSDLEGIDERVAIGYDENGDLELVLNF